MQGRQDVKKRIVMSAYRIIEYLIETRFWVLALLATDQQVDVAEVRTGPQQFLHQHFAHESSRSGNQHVGSPVELLYLRTSVTDALHVWH